ncbi:aldo/keto reductase [Polynucleobacter paneuropaeus]|nr:aldo/keto reductase [Polynucleobacter paneuropaeus]
MLVKNPAKRLALGTAQFGLNYGVANQSGLVQETDVEEILGAAWNSGIRTLDTAVSYGKSEQVLGDCGVQNWEVITKVPPIPKDCSNIAAWVIEQVTCSLERLGVDHLYGVLLHRPEQILGGNGPQILDALEKIKSLGLTKKIGISIYDPSELSRLTALFKFDLVQAPMNILDQRLINSGWAKKLKDYDVEIHIRSVFLQGLLLIPQQERPLKFEKFHSTWSEWDRWLLAVNLTPLQACLAYVLSFKEIDKLVVGVDSKNQLRDIVASTGLQLSSYPQWTKELPEELINPTMWDQL